MHDLAVIVVSTNEAHWLVPCLSTLYAHVGPISIEVVVADNESTDGTADLVEREFPQARTVRCENRGFSHANNRGLETTSSRYVLFLNPDTEILEGTFAELVEELDRRPTIGLVGVNQRSPEGDLHPTIRYFPNALRALGDALGADRLPRRPSWLGERESDLSRYERDVPCDWTIGSFMLVRREAIDAAGVLDDRFFIYSEEVDFCLRIRRAGWEIHHLPSMTILHHVRKGGTARTVNERMVRQNAFAQLQYARKNFSPAHRGAFRAALFLRYGLRSLAFGRNGDFDRQRRAAARAAARIVLGLGEPPFPLDDRPAGARSAR
jgi:GT2 family glycosyltransferase